MIYLFLLLLISSISLAFHASQDVGCRIYVECITELVLIYLWYTTYCNSSSNWAIKQILICYVGTHFRHERFYNWSPSNDNPYIKHESVGKEIINKMIRKLLKVRKKFYESDYWGKELYPLGIQTYGSPIRTYQKRILEFVKTNWNRYSEFLKWASVQTHKIGVLCLCVKK